MEKDKNVETPEKDPNLNTGAVAGGGKKEKKEEATVQISKDDLATLLDRLNTLETKDKEREAKESGVLPTVFNRTREKLIKLRTWFDTDGKEKFVLGWDDRGVYEEPNPLNNKDKVLWINLILEGNTEAVKTNYLHYLNNAKIQYTKCVDTTIKEEIKNYGVTYAKVEKDGRMMETDQQVPLDVKFSYRIYTLETKDGHQITINEKFIH